MISNKVHNKKSTPYLMFKYAIKTEITRRYYKRRLKKWVDFIEFERGPNHPIIKNNQTKNIWKKFNLMYNYVS